MRTFLFPSDDGISAQIASAVPRLAASKRASFSGTSGRSLGPLAMVSALSAYRKKRDFDVTPEPVARRARRGKSLAFVVQKHAARRLHYDFRLELDGTLKSWAVPKGPSLDPAQKRMAVHVEDHPLDYANFEGVIPAGQYGAGSVIVWDRGQWIPIGDAREGMREGKLKFELRGEKLSGQWTLVRMRAREGERQEHWLLMKERDPAAQSSAAFDVTKKMPESVLGSSDGMAEPSSKEDRAVTKKVAGSRVQIPVAATKAPLPASMAPQLATLVSAAPTDPGWAYEVKFDGYRILTRIAAGKVRLFTRNGHDWTAKMPALAHAVSRLGLASGWLDGEIVVLDRNGQSDFQALQNSLDTAGADAIRYFVFDLPYCAGYDMRELPLALRRSILSQILKENPSDLLNFSDSFEINGAELLQAACGLHLEGIIGKRVDAPYRSTRSKSWIKLKCTQRQEFVVGGYTEPKGTRAGIGALLLGRHDAAGALRYAGDVGTGFSEATLKILSKKLGALGTKKPPFVGLPHTVKANWVRPKLVAEVSYSQLTRNGRVRHAVFHGLRTDKPAASVIEEVAVPAPTDMHVREKKRAPKRVAPRATARATHRSKAVSGVATVGNVVVSHGERVIDAASGCIKLDLVRYYERIAPLLLPQLTGRAVSLVRAPEGVGGEIFFQKHAGAVHLEGVGEIDDPEASGERGLIEILSQSGIIAAAQFNVIEFHTWNANRRKLEKPDRFVLDLDPGDRVPFEAVIEAALLIRALLEEIGLPSFVKTSGGKGLHVVVPIAPRYSWDAVKGFSKAIVLHLAHTIPDRFVAKSGATQRVGRIFVDYLRNGRGATTAAAYSARARAGLGVSTPLRWAELESVKASDQWSIRNVFERLEQLSADPWEDYTRERPTLSAAFARIQFKPPR